MTQREQFEAAVIARLKESGFLEIEIRTECLVRCDDGYQDELINAGWHYWNAASVARAANEPRSQAIADVAAERKRQIEVEDFDASHDDMATRGQLATAAACYAPIDIDATDAKAARDIAAERRGVAAGAIRKVKIIREKA